MCQYVDTKFQFCVDIYFFLKWAFQTRPGDLAMPDLFG